MNTFKYLLFHASPICPLSRKMPCPIVLAHCRKWNRILTARVLSRPGAHLGILGEQGRLRPPADPARQRACAPAKRLIRKMGGSRSAPLLDVAVRTDPCPLEPTARPRREAVPASEFRRGKK